MFGAILKATNSSFQKSMTFCRSIYVKKVMKLLAFIFEQPSYIVTITFGWHNNTLCITHFQLVFGKTTLIKHWSSLSRVLQARMIDVTDDFKFQTA